MRGDGESTQPDFGSRSHVANAYGRVLNDHLCRPTEHGLQAAYELGRRALADQVSILELVGLHRAASVPLVRGAPELLDDADAFLREALAAYEITQRGYLEAQQRASAEKKRVETIIAGMGEALVAVDHGGRVTDFNSAAEQLFAVPAARAVGQPAETVMRMTTVGGLDLTDLMEQPPPEPWSQAVTIVRPDGLEVPAVVTAAPLRDGTDRVVGAVWVARDVTRDREVERMKTEFLTTISHELRTPLTPIKGYAAVMRRHRLTEERVFEYAGEIDRGVQRLERTVDQLLSFATMEAGQLDLRREPVSVGALLERVATRWQPRVDADRHPFSWLVPVDLPLIDADPRLMEQALDELVDNAVKYTPDGSPVTLSATAAEVRDRPYVRVTVTDQGVGIPGDQVSTVFDAFTQADASPTRRFNGLGLGLALVARIVRSHGGEPEYDADADGTRFSLVLPACRDADGSGDPCPLTTHPAVAAPPHCDRQT